MISCKEASRLASQQIERQTTFRERVQLRLHLVIYAGCQRMENQFQFLRVATGAWMSQKV